MALLIAELLINACNHPTPVKKSDVDRNLITVIDLNKPFVRIPVRKRTTTADSVLSDDYKWFSDSLYHRKDALLAYYFKKWNRVICVPIAQSKQLVRQDFGGYKKLGDINSDGKLYSVFVLSPFSLCAWEEGQCHYFTDTSLPRLTPDCWCSHPGNVFSAPDIDGDGIGEVGYYFSSCASRFKSMHLYRLRNKRWECIAVAEFDIMTQDPTKIRFEDQVQRISKNRFRFHNFFAKRKNIGIPLY